LWGCSGICIKTKSNKNNQGMNKFNFEIGSRSFFIDEQNYESQFQEIISELTSNHWIVGQDSHSLQWERGGQFLHTIRAEILSICKNSTDYAFHIEIIKKLLYIRGEFLGDTSNPGNNRSDAPLNKSNYSSIERLSLAIELYATEFKETLTSNDLDIAFIKIISYLKKDDLDYSDSDSIDTNKLQDYIKWLKKFNQEIQQNHETTNRISKIETALETFRKREAEINITNNLESAWTSKRINHIVILAVLCLIIFATVFIGCRSLQKWMIDGSNSAFDNCCEKMGFVDLIYGGVIYWGIQYKAITILVWFVAVSLLIQLAKSQWHLINDASERIAIIRTYKIFTENNQFGEPGKYMDALVQSIFRSADDGLLKDVKNIYTSGFSSNGEKSSEEK
jgi:hypothetical protein